VRKNQAEIGITTGTRMSHSASAKSTRLALASLVLAIFNPAQAALAPQYQNANDLDAMVAFVKQHPRVASTLKSIELQSYIVRFGDDCWAEFGRQKVDAPPGWVGPAAPLVLVRSNCRLD
jgi:hypothetical protein